jgi:hypothetical protein
MSAHACLRVVADIEAERVRTWATCGFRPDGTFVGDADEEDIEGMRRLLEADAAETMRAWLRVANENATVLQRAWRARPRPYYVI